MFKFKSKNIGLSITHYTVITIMLFLLMRRILKTTVHANVRMSEQIFCAGHYYNSLNIFKFVFH